MGRRIANKTFDIPPEQNLPGTNVKMPFVIVGDEAFALQENLMKPFPRSQSLQDNEKAIYNYRLSRARRIVENAFGILCAQFRIFYSSINAKPETVDNIITATCILHNIMRNARGSRSQRLNGEQQNFMDEIAPSISAAGGRSDLAAQAIRDKFKVFFNGVGAVSWQRKQIGLD